MRTHYQTLLYFSSWAPVKQRSMINNPKQTLQISGEEHDQLYNLAQKKTLAFTASSFLLELLLLCWTFHSKQGGGQSQHLVGRVATNLRGILLNYQCPL